MLQHCGRQTQIQELDAKDFRERKSLFVAACLINPSKHEERTGVPILNLAHQWARAKIMLQYCGRRAQIQELDARFFRKR